MKNLIENLRMHSADLRNDIGECDITLMLDQAADAISVFKQNQIASEISALGDMAHTVLVYREVTTGDVQTAYLDAAHQFEDRAVYEHIATINPQLWIKEHFDEIYHPKECEPLTEASLAAGAAPVPTGRKVTTTRIANHLKKSPLGDISMYRNGFFDGAKWAAKEQPVPEGMQLVPIEPTEAMLNAPPNAWSADALITYKAMLEAAKEKGDRP